MASGADRLVRALLDERITHVVGLPDNTLALLFSALDGSPDLQLIPVTREGEAFAIASGLWLGGKRPCVAIQNTGLLESGDSLRGTAVRMSVPLPMIITYRGYARMTGAGVEPGTVPPEPFDLIRADVDSVAPLTESTLDAWGVPFALASADDLASDFAQTSARARAERRPVALLLTRALV